MNSNIQIGTCGYGRAKKDDYAARLTTVEIQHTFYKPPQIKTLERWRTDMPEDFEFTLKAWQFVTHEAGSPTYRRLKRPLTEKEESEAGAFKPTDTVDEGWQVTLECARRCEASEVGRRCTTEREITLVPRHHLRDVVERKIAVTDQMDDQAQPRGTRARITADVHVVWPRAVARRPAQKARAALQVSENLHPRDRARRHGDHRTRAQRRSLAGRGKMRLSTVCTRSTSEPRSGSMARLYT